MKQIAFHALEFLALIGALAAITAIVWIAYAIMNVPPETERCFTATLREADYCRTQWRW